MTEEEGWAGVMWVCVGGVDDGSGREEGSTGVGESEGGMWEGRGEGLVGREYWEEEGVLLGFNYGMFESRS